MLISLQEVDDVKDDGVAIRKDLRLKRNARYGFRESIDIFCKVSTHRISRSSYAAGLPEGRVIFCCLLFLQRKTRQLIAPGAHHPILQFPKSHPLARDVKRNIQNGKNPFARSP